MADYIVRATAAGAAIRAFAITSRDLVETARQDHNTSPIMTAALGRLLSGGAMMGTMLKGEKDLLTLQIQCSGPARGLTVTADANGHVKGFVNNPIVELPPNKDGHLNVGGALDLGILSVIKDMGLKEPYVGQCQLQTGEIAEDLTYYFATSEQIPSAVGLGVLMNKNNTVRQAGGFIIQLMPFTSDEIIEKLENRIAEIDSVTMMDPSVTVVRGKCPQFPYQILGQDNGLVICLSRCPRRFFFFHGVCPHHIFQGNPFRLEFFHIPSPLLFVHFPDPFKEFLGQTPVIPCPV